MLYDTDIFVFSKANSGDFHIHDAGVFLAQDLTLPMKAHGARYSGVQGLIILIFSEEICPLLPTWNQYRKNCFQWQSNMHRTRLPDFWYPSGISIFVILNRCTYSGCFLHVPWAWGLWNSDYSMKSGRGRGWSRLSCPLHCLLCHLKIHWVVSDEHWSYSSFSSNTLLSLCVLDTVGLSDSLVLTIM